MATAIEYGLISGLIAVAIIAGVTATGSKLDDLLNHQSPPNQAQSAARCLGYSPEEAQKVKDNFNSMKDDLDTLPIYVAGGRLLTVSSDGKCSSDSEMNGALGITFGHAIVHGNRPHILFATTSGVQHTREFVDVPINRVVFR